MPEFTGERVIPGLVDANLLNEHLARYRFAARFVQEGARVLDAGCGEGYGSAELSEAACITGADISSEAIAHARENFGRPGVQFLQAACEQMPFADASFDLVTSFEVIEHLERWPELLSEVRRVLKPTGTLLVSTPNKNYYAESRGESGPNPFHCHEFEYAEFQAALYAVFPHVRIWTQNYTEAIVFAPVSPSGAVLDATGDAAPEHAYFYVAACSEFPITANEVVAWMPSTGNALREREHHIAKLEGELAKKDIWLAQLVENHAVLQRSHEKAVEQIKIANNWAESLNQEIAFRDTRIFELQNEVDARLAWVADLEAGIHRGNVEIERLNAHRAELEANLAARAAWGASLDAELNRCTRELQECTTRLEFLHEEHALIANSKWIRLGRKLNLGPAVSGE